METERGEEGGGGHGGTTEEENNNNVNKKMIINNIMLKYRPIAPKPVGGDGATTVNSNKNSVVGLTKRKRKYVRVSDRRRTTVGTKDKAKQKEKDPATVSAPDPPERQEATSESVAEVRSEINGSEPQKQLLFDFFATEISAHQRSVNISDSKSMLIRDLSLSVPLDDGQIPTRVGTAEVVENIEARGSASSGGGGDVGGSTGESALVLSDLSTTVEMIESKKKQHRQGKEVVVVQSWVTVEKLTDACMDTAVGSAGLGSTDLEKKKNLEQDTCPGFISDATNHVPWTNLAYRKMVIGSRINDQRNHQPHRWLHLSLEEEEQDDDDDDVVVSLVEKERLPIMYPAFACLVRIQYYNNNHVISWTTRDQKEDNNKCCLTTMTVPCDVWRMDRGGFAWRLDTKAALSL